MDYAYWQWETTADGVVGHFGRPEMRWLRHVLPKYHQLLETRVSDYRYYDPLCDQLGIPLPTEPMDYPPLEALCVEAHGMEQDPALALWQEAQLLPALKADVETVLATLPATGSTVELHHREEIEAWYWVLINVRFVHGIRRNRIELAYEPEVELPGGLDMSDPGDNERTLLWWLAWAAWTLDEATARPQQENVARDHRPAA